VNLDTKLDFMDDDHLNKRGIEKFNDLQYDKLTILVGFRTK
jgi:hypothetical protein